MLVVGLPCFPWRENRDLFEREDDDAGAAVAIRMRFRTILATLERVDTPRDVHDRSPLATAMLAELLAATERHKTTRTGTANSDESAENPTAASQSSAQVAKYKRMLQARVPVPVVLRKMGEDAFDVARFEPAFDAIDIETFYRPAFVSATQPRTGRVVGSAIPKRERKKIHFDAVPKRLSTLPVSVDDSRATLWSRDCGSTEPSEETCAAFDAIFTKVTTAREAKPSPASGSDGKGPAPGASNGGEFIDDSRAQNISILLLGVKLSTDQWRQCVLGLTFNAEHSGSLMELLKMWPTAEEERASKLNDYDGLVLRRGSIAEDFFVSLRDIPRLKQKLECLYFRMLFPTRVFELRESMLLVVRGINQLIENRVFPAVMQRIFRLCCFVNDGKAGSESTTNAEGFRISTLPKLLSARSFDPNTSVLTAIVQAIKRDAPGFDTFAKELTLLSKCAAVSVEALRSELVSLEADHGKLTREIEKSALDDASGKENLKLSCEVMEVQNFHGIARNFAAEVELELRDLRVFMRDVNDACRRINVYLKEPEETPFAEVIGHVATFAEAYTAEQTRLYPPASERASLATKISTMGSK